MRHKKIVRSFGRHSAHRKATLSSLVRNLILYKRIETTLAKAKEARRLADRLVTLGKKATLHYRRMAYSVLRDRRLVGILFSDVAPLFINRKGGYTRIIHTRTRPGDGAELAILEWTEKKQAEDKTPKKKDKKALRQGDVKADIEDAKIIAEKPAKAVEKKPQPEEKPKPKLPEEKPRPETPGKDKGFLGGLRKWFGKKDKEK